MDLVVVVVVVVVGLLALAAWSDRRDRRAGIDPAERAKAAGEPRRRVRERRRQARLDLYERFGFRPVRGDGPAHPGDGGPPEPGSG